jgi:hypothetical protein
MILCPIGEDRTVSPVGDQLLRKLGDCRIEVIHNVMDDAPGLGDASGIIVLRVGLDGVGRFEAVHVDVSVIFELLVEFFAEGFVQVAWKVSESILHG